MLEFFLTRIYKGNAYLAEEVLLFS